MPDHELIAMWLQAFGHDCAFCLQYSKDTNTHLNMELYLWHTTGVVCYQLHYIGSLSTPTCLCGSWRLLHLPLIIVRRMYISCLRRHHTVLKLTPDGHMKIKHCMIFGSFFGSQTFRKDSRSWYWYRRTTTRVHSMAYDALTNGPMFLQCFYDHFQTLGECEACTMITLEFKDFLNCVST